MEASTFIHGTSGPATAGLGAPPLSAELTPVATSIEAHAAFSSPDPAPSVLPTLGELLQPAWSPYGELVRPPEAPPHDLAAGALLFDAFG